MLYDSEALYVGFECEQVKTRVVRRLTRRGRLVESDWVEIDIGKDAVNLDHLISPEQRLELAMARH